MNGLFGIRSSRRWSLHHPWLALGVLLMGPFGAFPQVTNSSWVDFADPNLSNAVHEALGVPPGRLSSVDVLGLTNLVACGRGITNLDGLQWAVNLRQLYLNANRVSDLSPLSGLTNVSSLNVGDNLVTNAGSLGGLVNLDRLLLFANSVTDLNFLQSLTNLSVLNLINNPINDISTFPMITNLGTLSLGGNAISNLAGLSGFTGLTNLAVVGAGLTNAAFLSSLTQLRILDLDNNHVGDASPLAALVGLTDLNLDHNQITNAAVLATLTNLTSLQMLSNGLSDVAFLSGMKGLRLLGLDYNSVADVSALAGLTNLAYLSLENNLLVMAGSSSNANALSQLPNLTTLNLGGNLIGNVAFVSGMSASSNLLNLSLAHNVITNISGLQTLTALQGLDLGDNRLTDVSVVTNLSKLVWVNLQWNLLNTNLVQGFGVVLQSLIQRGITVYFQPQHQPPRISFNSGASSLLNLSRWGVADGTISVAGFVVAADGAPSTLQISASSSNPSLMPSSNIVVQANQSGWTLAVKPISGLTTNANLLTANPNLLTVTLNVIDELGQTTSLGLQVTVISKQPVVVSDPNLQSAIRLALNKPSGALNNIDLFGLTSLSAYNANINSLSGLEWASNLVSLDLGGNSISDLSPLQGLAQLKALFTYNNLITDLSPLVSLTNLDYAELRWNWFTNLNLLAQLTNETSLFVGGNAVSNVSALTKLSKLKLLDLDQCSISNLSGLRVLSNLTVLDISYNPVTNLTSVGGLSGLTNLYLNGDHLSDLTLLTNLNLSLLSCYSNNVMDLSPLAGLTNLEVLNAGHNPFSSSVPICALTNVQAIQLSDTVLDGLAWWQCLPALRHLDLGDDGLGDTTALASLTNLQSLSLAGNPLTNLTGLSSLTNLVHLNLDRALNEPIGGKVTRDFTVLQTFAYLSFLSASQNQLTNINGLTNLTALQEVDVRTNVLDLGPNSTALSVIQNLTNRLIKVRYEPQDQPPNFKLGSWPPTLNLYSSWAVATNAPSSFSFTVGDDVTSGGELHVSVALSNPGLGNIVISGTNDSRTLTFTATNGAGPGNMTVIITDGSGLQTNFTIAVQVLEPQSVFIPDPNLEQAVRAVFGKPIGDLTSVDMLGLTVLYPYSFEIMNLAGLEWATNLNSLDLVGSAVADLGPLQFLNRLSWLSLFGNQVSDLSPLSGITNLTYLDVGSNPLTNYATLSRFNNLQTLELSSSEITDFSFLTNLNGLRTLNLDTNRLTNISMLSGLTNLSSLLLKQNRLSDLSALTNLEHLTYLDVSLNLLDVDNNAALTVLKSAVVFLLDLPQRQPPIIDAHTTWFVAPNTTSSLPFNVWDNGPTDEQLGAWIVSGSTDLVCQVHPGSGPGSDNLWTLSATPLGPPSGALVQYQTTLYATNDVGLTNAETLWVLVAPLSPVSGALLGDPGTVWTSGGNAPWFGGQSLVWHDNHAVVQSGALGNNQVSWLQTLVTGPGRLSFWWKVSSEMNLDWLEFDMAGQTNRISGEVDWQYQVVDVPPGSHTLTWRYYKSQQGSSGLDAAWLDEVTFQPLDPLVDSDGDGLSNLIEYSVGSDPLDPTDANTGIINFITQDNLGNRYLAMQYKSRNDVTAAQLRYAPEVSADKLTWYSDWKDVVVINVTAADSTFNWVTVRDATPITPAEARFMRLHVLSGTFPSPSPGPGPTYLLVHGTVRSGVVESTSPICVGTDTVIRGSGSLGSTTTLFSQRMVSPILSAGKITSISSSGINDTNAAFVTGQFGTNGMPAYLEFDNGTMLDIVNTTPQSVSLVANVTGLAVGDAYRIRAHSTVASIFGINNAAGLTGGPNASQADTVTLLIPETQQTITLFYYANPSFTTWEGWVRQDTFSPDPNEIIYPEQGIMIRRIIPGDLNLFLCGPIKSGPTVVPVQPGYNLVGTLKSLSTVPVSGLNLFTGFSSTGVIGGTQPSTGDNLIMVNQDGSVATFFYFYSPGVFQGWVNASGYTLAGGVLIPPGTAFFINRHGLGGFTWTIPAE